METNYRTAFENTQFIVYGEAYLAENIVIEIGKTPFKLFELFPKLKSWAFITAWNPLPIILSEEENFKRNILMESDIAIKGFKFYRGIGKAKDEGWQEASIFILDINEAKATKIGAKYGQMAYVFGIKNKPAQLIFI